MVDTSPSTKSSICLGLQDENKNKIVKDNMIKIFIGFLLLIISFSSALDSKLWVFEDIGPWARCYSEEEKNNEIVYRLEIVKIYVEEAMKLPHDLESYLTAIYTEIQICRQLSQRD